MFKSEMKSLIKFAMEKNIEGLETKRGYNGAPILRISAQNINDIKLIQEWCKTLGYNTKLFNRNDKMLAKAFQEFGYDLFCIFGEDTEDKDFFEIK